MNEANKKPALIAISGLSGSGKSTLARALHQNIKNSVHIDSDVTRKEIFGVAATDKLPPEAYTWDATQKMIKVIEQRVAENLKLGKTVITSSVLAREDARKRQETLAAENGADFTGIWLKTDVQTLFNRVAARTNDASDADVSIVAAQAKNMPPEMNWPVIDASLARDRVLEEALKIINKAPENPPSRGGFAPKP